MDACLTDPSGLELFDGYEPIFILVYAPLKVLVQRLKNRGGANVPSQKTMRRKKNIFLKSFTSLYKKIADDDDPENFLDTISSSDLLEYSCVEEGDICSANLRVNLRVFLEKFDLEKRKTVKIVPEMGFDMIVNTESQSLNENYQTIKNFFLGL